MVSEVDQATRERVLLYAGAGYRRRDIADLCGVTMLQLHRVLVSLGIAEEYPSARARRKRAVPVNQCGRQFSWNGPERFEEAVYEE